MWQARFVLRPFFLSLFPSLSGFLKLFSIHQILRVDHRSFVVQAIRDEMTLHSEYNAQEEVDDDDAKELKSLQSGFPKLFSSANIVFGSRQLDLGLGGAIPTFSSIEAAHASHPLLKSFANKLALWLNQSLPLYQILPRTAVKFQPSDLVCIILSPSQF